MFIYQGSHPSQLSFQLFGAISSAYNLPSAVVMVAGQRVKPGAHSGAIGQPKRFKE